MPTSGHDEAARRRRQEIQRRLDEALADSFPASDPVAIVTSQAEEDWAEEPAEPQEPGAPAAPETQSAPHSKT
jgi:hypothetical protein